MTGSPRCGAVAVATRRDARAKKLREELRGMPRGDLSQNELRMVYAIQRQHDLTQDPESLASDSLKRAVDSVKKRHPMFAPVFDAAAFALTSPGRT